MFGDSVNEGRREGEMARIREIAARGLRTPQTVIANGEMKANG
jgi:hypothetical protein